MTFTTNILWFLQNDFILSLLNFYNSTSTALGLLLLPCSTSTALLLLPYFYCTASIVQSDIVLISLTHNVLLIFLIPEYDINDF